MNDGWSVHVIPDNDTREHLLLSLCWCLPAIGEHGEIIHNSNDGRELYEHDNIEVVH